MLFTPERKLNRKRLELRKKTCFGGSVMLPFHRPSELLMF
jgi:hypothetical protein